MLKRSRLAVLAVIITFTLLAFLSRVEYGTFETFPAPPFQVNISGPVRNATASATLARPTPYYGNPDEIRQVVFAKVHKAASSTVQNILLRFALARQLDLLLPTQGPIINEAGSVIAKTRVIPHPTGELFDILCSHVVYDDAQIRKYFPDSAVRVTILREPMEHALSALKFYSTMYPQKNYLEGIKKHPTDPRNGYLAHPEDFYPNLRRCDQPGSYASNRMSHDLGFDPDPKNFGASKKNRTKIQQFLEKVDSQFDLVLISDYFDESMVLLKRTLRWEMKDIIYLKVNVAKAEKNDRWNQPLNVNSTVALIFRRCNRLDYELYEFFLPLFLDRINKERFFREEVAFFKLLNKDILDYCTSQRTSKPFRVPESSWSNEFFVSKSDCDLMSMLEIKFVEKARKAQLKRYEALKKTLPKRNGNATHAQPSVKPSVRQNTTVKLP